MNYSSDTCKISILREGDDRYLEEFYKFESKIHIVYDSSSVKMHKIEYYDTDYLLTKIGALVAFYGQTVGVVCLAILNGMFFKHIIKRMSERSAKEGDTKEEKEQKTRNIVQLV